VSKLEPSDEKLKRYKSQWLRHVTIMTNKMIPNVMMNYKQNGRRQLGRPLKDTVRRGRNKSIKSQFVTDDDLIFQSISFAALTVAINLCCHILIINLCCHILIIKPKRCT